MTHAKSSDFNEMKKNQNQAYVGEYQNWLEILIKIKLTLVNISNQF